MVRGYGHLMARFGLLVFTVSVISIFLFYTWCLFEILPIALEIYRSLKSAIVDLYQ
jgi:hypothetical protein